MGAGTALPQLARQFEHHRQTEAAQADREGRLPRLQERFQGGRRGRPHVLRQVQAGQARPSAQGRRRRQVRPDADRRAADAGRGLRRVRDQSELLPIATKASNDCVTPPEVLKQSTELGITMIGVPEELGGAVEERSAVTSRPDQRGAGQGRPRPGSRGARTGGGLAPRSASGATPTSRPPTCPSSSARTSRPRHSP